VPTRIESIHLNIQTVDAAGSGTDGSVYLGFCGREFHADTAADDFERGSGRNYIFGEGANVNNASTNDPRRQLLFLENVDTLPVYIRFQPRDSGDNWQLDRVEVTVNGQLFPMWDTAAVIQEGIWLGERSGLYVYIPKHQDIGEPVAQQ
jgi:hypothetical protein